ncbi:MAG: hypothetical protein KC910_30405 [Candidatus Eremiobacteraeota bacterium]|nr:hypothetical protein [Candidatus Eremiobacteraeota bacterium]
MKIGPAIIQARPRRQTDELFLPDKVELPPEPVAPVKPWTFPDEPVLLGVGAAVGATLGAVAGYYGGIGPAALGGLIGAGLTPVAAMLMSSPSSYEKFSRRWLLPAFGAVLVPAGALLAGHFSDGVAAVALGGAGLLAGAAGPISGWMAYEEISGRDKRYREAMDQYRQADHDYHELLARGQAREKAEQRLDQLDPLDLQLDEDAVRVGDIWVERENRS